MPQKIYRELFQSMEGCSILFFIRLWRWSYFALQFKPSDISYDHFPRFYCDCLLTAWSTINNKRVCSSNQVFDEILWNNQFLSIGNKPLFSKKLFAKGIVHVSDILSEDGKLLSWDHFRGEGLNFNDHLLIFGLSKALPGSWRNLLHTNNNDNAHQKNERNSELSLQLNDEAVSLSALTFKKLYWLLVAQKRVSPTASQKYETLYPNDKINWDLIYSIHFKVTVYVKRCFQFNLLHRIIYTNKLLCKMNLVAVIRICALSVKKK